MLAPMTLAEYLAATETSQAAFGDRVGVSQGRVSQWLAGETIPAEKAKAIEEATSGRVTRHELRPDLWDAPKQKAA